MSTLDPIALLDAVNPLPANQVATLAGAPACDSIRAAIDRRRRETRPSRSWHLPRRPAALAAVVIAVLAVPALALSGALDSLFGFSNGGTSITTSQVDLNDVQILEQDHVDAGAGIKLLATRDGEAFYVSRTSDGRTCLLNGPAGGTAPTQILIGTPCERDFPSPQHPLLGQYTLVRKPVTPLTGAQAAGGIPPGKLGPQTVGGLQGLAADGVATVEAIDADGHVILQASVIDNVYLARLDVRDEQITVPAAKIVALDTNGAIVYTENIPQPAFG
jgi:hypothetical protein